MKLEVLKKGYYYHIFNRGINGCTIFKNDENNIYFLKLVDKYLSEKVSMYAYCLMDNHFHFIIHVNDDEKVVTQSFSNLFNAYAKVFNKQNKRTGSLFEKHFKRIRLKDEDYLKQLIIYVHLNPKNHFNIDFATYKFSSYQSIVSKKETKIKRDEVLELFDGVDNFIYNHKKKSLVLNEKYTFE